MDSCYTFTKLDNEDILLTKMYIDIKKYTIEELENGDKILKRIKSIDIIDINDIKDYEFKKSIILKCFLNNQNITQLKYKAILNNIYNQINDGSKIIKNSCLNVKTIKKTNEGFYYLENIGISIQGSESNKCLHEIVKQCIEKKIKISMQIKLINENIINICF